MKKVCKHIKQSIFISIMLVGLFAHAQSDKVYRAQMLLSEKKITEARMCIDSVVVHPDSKEMFEAWTIRAFIYFEEYKRTNKAALNSSTRDTVINSLKKSYSLKPSEDFISNNNKLAANLASNYYNIAKAYLQDSLNYETSSYAFGRFKELMLMSDPKADMAAKDVEFYLAVGYLYSDKFNKDNNDSKSLEIAKVALLKVLDIQPNEQSANMNMGLMYLNKAINIVEKSDDATTLSDLEVIQDNIIKLAKQAEQFLLKVYAKDNSNKKAVEALFYVYKLLMIDDKRDEFQKKCSALGIKISEG